jgi:hypothetical protein
VFEMLDSDGDGRLTRLEYNMGFDILDKDQDGFLTRSEFGIASELYFDKLDKRGDGRLSREEYNGGFALIDTDCDGFISRTEFNEFIQLQPPEEDENEERADRRYAVLDRDDPRVAEIDALVAELNEKHTKTGIPAYPTWKEDAKEAERIFLETPDELSAWLERMRIKSLSKQEKRERVLQLAARLVRDDVIAIPPQQWRSDVEEASEVLKVETKTPEEGFSAEAPPAPRLELTEEEAATNTESAILRRLGFIFIAYRVEYWWWEGVEMFRKFMLTWSLFSTPLFQPPFPCRLAAPLLLPYLCVSLIVLGSSQLASCVLLYISIHVRLVSRVGQSLIQQHAQLSGVPPVGRARAACDRDPDYLLLPTPQPHLSALLHTRLKQPAVTEPYLAVPDPLLRHPHRIHGVYADIRGDHSLRLFGAGRSQGVWVYHCLYQLLDACLPLSAQNHDRYAH